MRCVRCLLVVAVIGFVVAACGDSSGPGRPTATAITRIAGDNQVGPVGGTLPDSLVVRVLGSDGKPFVGGSVTWTVTSGPATVNPANAVVDANGEALTRVSLPASSGGNVTITASVAGLSPVPFAASAVPACDYLFPYSLGRTVDGQLSSLDCNVALGNVDSIYYYDFYRVSFPAQQGISVTMSTSVPATTLDAWLDLFTGPGAYLAWDDDSSQTNGNAHLEAIVGAGDFVIGASSQGTRQAGSYTLRSAARPATLTGCRVIWVTRGIAVTETVGPADCVDNSTGSPFYFDFVWVLVDSGATLQVRMQSSAVNPLLYFYDVFGDSLVAQNDDSAAGTQTAFISYTHAAPDFGLFELVLATSASVQTGGYTMTIGGPLAATSAVRAGVARDAAPLFALPALRDSRGVDPAAAARARAARARARNGP